MCHLEQLYREFVGIITIAYHSNMLLIKMTISFCPAGILYCFNLMTSAGLGISIGPHLAGPINKILAKGQTYMPYTLQHFLGAVLSNQS